MCRVMRCIHYYLLSLNTKFNPFSLLILENACIWGMKGKYTHRTYTQADLLSKQFQTFYRNQTQTIPDINWQKDKSKPAHIAAAYANRQNWHKDAFSERIFFGQDRGPTHQIYSCVFPSQLLMRWTFLGLLIWCDPFPRLTFNRVNKQRDIHMRTHILGSLPHRRSESLRSLFTSQLLVMAFISHCQNLQVKLMRKKRGNCSN